MALYVTLTVHEPVDVPVITPAELTEQAPDPDQTATPSPFADAVAVAVFPTLKLPKPVGIVKLPVRVFWVIVIDAETYVIE